VKSDLSPLPTTNSENFDLYSPRESKEDNKYQN